MAQIWNQNDLVKGDNLLLWLTSGKTVVAYATSCSLQTDAETIDTSSKFSSKWANAMGGKASYTISADALINATKTCIDNDLNSYKKDYLTLDALYVRPSQAERAKNNEL